MLKMNQIFILFTLQILTTSLNAQQNYSRSLGCDNPTPASLYTCNDQEYNSCQTFLITNSQNPFDSVPTIASLMSINPSTLAKTNNVTRSAVFPTNKQLLVPVNCFCSGNYYQANTSFRTTNEYGTYFTIASKVYRGLTPCNALRDANSINEYRLFPGLELRVPLRCACPTRNQKRDGTRYLVTYSLNSDDTIPDIANRFSVSEGSILYANGLNESLKLYPLTTILIPLPNQPSSSQMRILELSPAPPTKSVSKRKYLTGGIAAGCSSLVFGVFLFVFLSCRKRKKETWRVPNENTRKQVLPEDIRVEIASFEQDLKVFEFEEIRKATNDFSSRNKIKGSVYRGDFEGEILVVKRMSTDVMSELEIFKRINHFNLIKIHGVSESQGCFYLVFEYMTKGSLREWLENENKNCTTGSWMKRIRIALDVASGLHYLHSFTRPAYVHMNINSSNILLNSNLRAKIANFTLARASEYREEVGYVSPKIDVFAFGVILLELITGKDAVIVLDGKEVLLSETIVSLMERENAGAVLEDFIHHPLKGKNGTEFAMRIAKLSKACLSPEPERRPVMEEVISTLLKIQADVQKSESLDFNNNNSFK